VAYPLDHEVSGDRRLLRQRLEGDRHPDIVASVLEAVRGEALAEVGRPLRGPDMPRARDPVRLHSLEGGFDLPVRFFRVQVCMDDAVVVVDGGVPDDPTYSPVVAFLGARHPSKRHQELGVVLLDGEGLIHAL
jgi:hypothetical protein